MSLTITIDGQDVTDKVRLENWQFVMTALQGEVGTGRVTVDDTTGSADWAPAMTRWTATESLATPTTIASGWIAERDIERGPLRVAVQRQQVATLEDMNTALSDRVLKGSNAKRPEETDYQRIQWLVSTNALGMLDGAGHIPNTDTVTMEKTNYRGKYPLQVLDDCAEASGKNFFIYYKSGTGWELFYDKVEASDSYLTSSLQVSDDLDDVDSSTTFAPSNIEWQQDPERVYSGLLVKWASGWEFVSNSTTASTFRVRQKTVYRENIKSATRARQWAQRQLNKLDDEIKRLSLTISVPGTKLGQLRAGMRIQVKIRSRGITAYTYFRIASVEITPRQGSAGQSDVEYDVRLNMRDRIRPVNIGDIFADPETAIGQSGPGSGGGDSGGADGGSGTDAGGGTGANAGTFLLDDFDRETSYEIRTGTNEPNEAGGDHIAYLPNGAPAAEGDVVWIYCIFEEREGAGADFDIQNAFTPPDKEWDWTTNEGGDWINLGMDLRVRLVDGTEGFTGTDDEVHINFEDFSIEAGMAWVTGIIRGPIDDTAIDADFYRNDPEQVNYFRVLESSAVSLLTIAAAARTGTDAAVDDEVYEVTSQYGPLGDLDPDWTTLHLQPSHEGLIPPHVVSANYIPTAGSPHFFERAFDGQTFPNFDLATGNWANGMVLTVQDAPEQGSSGGWGSIPTTFDSPWAGGNTWTGTTASGTVTASLSSGTGLLTVTDDDSQHRETLKSDSPDDDSDEPWGPWAYGDAMFLIRWKVNPLGSTSDADANVLDFGIVTGDWNGVFRVHLGDNVNWSYMSPDQQRGVVILQQAGATASPFVARSLAADTEYWTRIDFRGTRARMKLWKVSDSEPVDWALDVAKVDDFGDDIGEFYVEVQANDGMVFTFESIDAVLGATDGPVSDILPPGDGTTTTWTITTWVPGSLKVWVDGIQTLPATVDIDAGTFTFDRAPAYGAVIRVEYVAA